ncbi:MAG TPA: phospho-N-acetylmuramoyl-pentapeptide-transferase [Candidatus Nanopelagicales bacterium]|nr:phospho-N-acetylmuramoyl-pentapeptide-transferase [Candidatus Nanopelagicales bacterium]
MKLVIFSGGFSLLVVLLGTPLLIRFLRGRGYSQAIRVSTEDEPYPEHEGKHGTPSMGGLAMLAGITLGYLGAHVFAWRWPSASGLLVLFLCVGLGVVGMTDDYLKIFKQRSTGVRGRTKLLGQAAVALVFAGLSLQFPDDSGRTPASLAISFFRDTRLVLPTAVFVLWIWFLVTATTNAVNLTDGLDGLATGAALLPFGAYTLLSVWQYGHDCLFGQPRCYDVRDPLDLAVFAAACAGACLGFLWWNTAPARIFMGDTGSLALGGGIAGLAVLSRTELLLPLLGGLFVIVTLSVIGQVGSYKLTGRRMFRMAPLHHHFEMKGWPEIQIVVRFWIIQGICISVALGLFYAEWVRQ